MFSTFNSQCHVFCPESVTMVRGAVSEAQCVSWRECDARARETRAARYATVAATDHGRRLVRADTPGSRGEQLHAHADNLAAVG